MVAQNNIDIKKISETLDNIRMSINKLNIDCASILKNIDLSIKDIERNFAGIYNELRNIDKHVLIAALLISMPKDPEKILQQYSEIIDMFVKQRSGNNNMQIPNNVRFC